MILETELARALSVHQENLKAWEKLIASFGHSSWEVFDEIAREALGASLRQRLTEIFLKSHGEFRG